MSATAADLAPLLGMIATVFLCVTIIAATAVHMTNEHDWRRVAVRVAGSWISAISLLMIGWTLKTP